MNTPANNFTIMHSSPTGCSYYEDSLQPSSGGRHPTRIWENEHEAIAFAEAEQAYANADGDPDGSRCIVYRTWPYRESDCIHITRPIQKLKPWEPQPPVNQSITLGLVAWFSTMSQHTIIPLEPELVRCQTDPDGKTLLAQWLQATFEAYQRRITTYNEKTWHTVAQRLLDQPLSTTR